MNTIEGVTDISNTASASIMPTSCALDACNLGHFIEACWARRNCSAIAEAAAVLPSRLAVRLIELLGRSNGGPCARRSHSEKAPGYLVRRIAAQLRGIGKLLHTTRWQYFGLLPACMGCLKCIRCKGLRIGYQSPWYEVMVKVDTIEDLRHLQDCTVLYLMIL